MYICIYINIYTHTYIYIYIYRNPSPIYIYLYNPPTQPPGLAFSQFWPNLWLETQHPPRVGWILADQDGNHSNCKQCGMCCWGACGRFGIRQWVEIQQRDWKGSEGNVVQNRGSGGLCFNQHPTIAGPPQSKFKKIKYLNV